MYSASQIVRNLYIVGALAFFGISQPVHGQCPQICDGNSNTALGDSALSSLTTGFGNTATGDHTLNSNTTGYYNTALGGQALEFNTTGNNNTATGLGALINNTTGIQNTANGATALFSSTTGVGNTASGFSALFSNTTGNNNTATGDAALLFNTTGFNNTASGLNALINNATGNNNTANGFQALLNNTGSSNIALGESAGINLTTGTNNIDIGNKGVAAESNTIRIGKRGTQTATYVAGIRGTTVAGGISVQIDANGRLGTTTSSAHYKKDIRPMDNASESILFLQPVTFCYKKELDPAGIPQFGLVAEQVEKVNPDLVARDDQGKPYTVRYDAVNAMLLNEFLKEHQRVQQQEVTITQLKAELKETTVRQQKQIEALSAGLQKVNAELELTKTTPRMVLNNQ